MSDQASPTPTRAALLAWAGEHLTTAKERANTGGPTIARHFAPEVAKWEAVLAVLAALAAQPEDAGTVPLSEYLKDGETAAECIARNRADVDLALGLLAKEKNRTAVLLEALRSIANNSCCDGCQEAAKVAKSALGRL